MTIKEVTKRRICERSTTFAVIRHLSRLVRFRRVANPESWQLAITLSWPKSWKSSGFDPGPLDQAARSLSQDAIKLNVGGGKGHPALDGWTVVDLRESTADIALDITSEKLPFEDNSVDVIFTSHTLEHIYPQHLGFVLSEFFRVLKTGSGLLRISVPNIVLAIEAYRTRDYSFFESSHVSIQDRNYPIGGMLASWLYSTRLFTDSGLKHGEGHVHCFDFDYLKAWLERAGFGEVWQSNYLQSRSPELRTPHLDLHPQDSLFVEARKTNNRSAAVG